MAKKKKNAKKNRPAYQIRQDLFAALDDVRMDDEELVFAKERVIDLQKQRDKSTERVGIFMQELGTINKLNDENMIFTTTLIRPLQDESDPSESNIGRSFVYTVTGGETDGDGNVRPDDIRISVKEGIPTN